MDSYVVGETATLVVSLSATSGPASSVGVFVRTPDCTVIEVDAEQGASSSEYTADVVVGSAGEWQYEFVGVDGDVTQGCFLAVPRRAVP